MKNQKPGIKDYLIHAKYWVLIWVKIASLFARHGIYDSARDLIRYPWLLKALKVTGLMRRLARGKSGRYREAIELALYNVVLGTVEMLEGVFFHRDKLILNEDMVPPEICRAMGLRPWTVELLGILLPMLEPGAVEKYIDASENNGIPADICSLPKSTMGIVMQGQMPGAQAIVSSNLPCDGGMTSYELIEKEMKAPIFRLDIPHNFYNERATEYFSGQLKEMIAWLEEHTPGKMDWERLRQILNERNRMAEMELEIWDMIRTRPAPMAGEPIYLGHLWNFNIFPGAKTSARFYEKLLEMTRKNMEQGVHVVQNERFRVVLWNPPLLHFIDLFAWAEKAYGVSLIIDSMTFNNQSLIDTSTNDSMLKGLGDIIMQGPMARHTRGPAENYLDDIFRIYRQFDLDMVWVAGHVGCKNTAALNGILRERCRDENIPLLIIEYDLSDPRITPREGIIEQVDYFMENIMDVKRPAGEMITGPLGMCPSGTK